MNDLRPTDRSDPDFPALPDEIQPPSDLEHAVVVRLSERGLIAVNTPNRSSWWRVVAAAVLLAVGFAGGRFLPDAPAGAPAEPEFLLLLEDTPASTPPNADSLRVQVAAYRSWAMRLQAEGRLVLAEKLGEEEWVVAPGSGGSAVTRTEQGAELGGLFVVRAGDIGAALALAREAPHVAYGGRIVVRPIDPT